MDSCIPKEEEEDDKQSKNTENISTDYFQIDLVQCLENISTEYFQFGLVQCLENISTEYIQVAPQYLIMQKIFERVDLKVFRADIFQTLYKVNSWSDLKQKVSQMIRFFLYIFK
jgi:hypothetical protein